jgi:CRISPR-associated endoribonuclease Cas6
MIYNSFLKLKKDQTICSFGRENRLKVAAIQRLKDQIVRSNKIMVKTLSPIVIKEHNGDNHTAFYHDLKTEQGLAQLLTNTKSMLLKRFINCYQEIMGLEINLTEQVETVKVKNYDIVFPATLGVLELRGDVRILDYLTKAGLGSKTNSGFGMLQII